MEKCTHVVADVIFLLKEIRKIGMTNCIKTDGNKDNSVFNVKRVNVNVVIENCKSLEQKKILVQNDSLVSDNDKC